MLPNCCGRAGRQRRTAALDDLAHFGSRADDYRLNRYVQERRAEEATGGYHAEMEDYFGRGGNEAIEKPLTLKDWLKHTRQPQLHDMEPEFQENYRGYELGRAHGLKGKIDHEELDREYFRSPHPEHFGAGYEEGLDEGLNKHHRIAGFGDPGDPMSITPSTYGVPDLFGMEPRRRAPSRGLSVEDEAKHERWRQSLNDTPSGRAWNHGLELGTRHAQEGYNSSEFDKAVLSHGQHASRFLTAYDAAYRHHGGTEKTGSVVAVLVSGIDDMPNGMRVVAHVSGNSIDVLHCPFCGSGAVIARSDGTIECGYCTSVFTVQVQPAFSGFPQSVDGQPYQWPGMPDPNSVMAPDAPPGTNVNPLAQDPMGAGAPPLGDGGLLGVGDSSDPAAGGEDVDDDSDDDDNPFAKDKDDSGDSSKSKSDKDSGDKSKTDKKPPQKKSSLILKTASGAQLDAAEFEAHLAIKFATNPLVVAQRVRESRARGLL